MRTLPKPDCLKRWIVAALAIGAGVYCALISRAHPPEETTIRNEAVSSFLFKTGQRMILRSNTTETLVQNASVTTVLDLRVSAEELVGNGVDSCLVTALLFDALGHPVPDGQPVAFAVSGGRFSNGRDTIYVSSSGGKAETWLRSDWLNGHTKRVAVSSTTLGAGGLWLAQQHSLVFYAAGVRGTVVTPSGKPLEGMRVLLQDSQGDEAGGDTTSSAGSFLIPVEKSGPYTLALRYRSSFGDEATVQAKASVTVPATGGVPAVAPLSSVSGRVVDAVSGEAIRKSGVPVMLYQSGSEATEGSRSTPVLQWTDDQGIFLFDSLAPGAAVIRSMDMKYAGELAIARMPRGSFVVDARLVLSGVQGFEIAKNSNRRIAEIGDAVLYTVDVKNSSDRETFRFPVLTDDLPLAFAYVRGSARRDGQALPDPAGNRHLRWALADSLPPGKSLRVTYAVNVGAGALESDGTNRAYAQAVGASGDTIHTAVASVQVMIRPGLFTDRGVVVGKVFYDNDGDGLQDSGDEGVPGVELLLEDGTRVVTGDDGKYSLPEVRPGQHVIRVNQWTLPHGSVLLASRSDFAGDGLTRFVRLTEGGIARSDFYVKRPDYASLEVTYGKISPSSAGERIEALYVLALRSAARPARMLLVDTLAPGFTFDQRSITWKRKQLMPAGAFSGTLWVDFSGLPLTESDTIRVSVIADSSTLGKPLMTGAKLVLGYGRGRDALFAARQLYRPSEQEAAPSPLVAVGGAGVSDAGSSANALGASPEGASTDGGSTDSASTGGAITRGAITEGVSAETTESETAGGIPEKKSLKKESSRRPAHKALRNPTAGSEDALAESFVGQPLLPDSSGEPEAPRDGNRQRQEKQFPGLLFLIAGGGAGSVLLAIVAFLYRRQRRSRDE